MTEGSFFSFAAASAVVSCAAALYAGDPSSGDKAARTDGQVQPLVLPSEFTDTRIYVNASLNGHAGSFELDTGSYDVYVDDDFAAAAEINLDAGSIVHDSGVAYRIRGGRALLRVGSFAAASATVHAIPLHRSDRGRVVAGLIGLGPFAASDLLVDFEQRTVELCAAPSSCVPRCDDEVPLHLDRSRPRVAVRLGQLPVSALIDSGYPRDLLVYPAFARSLALREGGLVRFAPGRGGRTGTARAAWAPPLTIGSRHLNGFVADVTQDPNAFGETALDLVIGIGVLRRLSSVTFALADNRFGYGSCSFRR